MRPSKVEYLVEEGKNFVKKVDKYIPFTIQISLISPLIIVCQIIVNFLE